MVSIYICLIIIYMRPPPAATSSVACVAFANNKQTFAFNVSVVGVAAFEVPAKDINCQDFATLSFTLRPNKRAGSSEVQRDIATCSTLRSRRQEALQKQCRTLGKYKKLLTQ